MKAVSRKKNNWSVPTRYQYFQPMCVFHEIAGSGSVEKTILIFP